MRVRRASLTAMACPGLVNLKSLIISDQVGGCLRFVLSFFPRSMSS